MRCAPSVIYPVGRSSFYGVVLVILGAGSLILLLAWGWESRLLVQWPWWMALFAWASWAGWSIRAWRSSPEGELEWDALVAPPAGAATSGSWLWYRAGLSAPPTDCQVRVMADWYQGMVLKVSPRGGPSLWVWAEQRRDEPGWPDFRRALVFSGGA